MRKKLLILTFGFATLAACAQNVGIGNNNPNTKLDINGALALRQGPDISLANGANDLVALPVNSTGDVLSMYRIVGPSAPFSLLGIVPAANADGQLVTLINTTNQVMTIVNNASSTPADGISTLTGGNLISVPGQSSVTFQYSKADQLWMVTGSENYTVASGNLPNLAGDANGSPTANQVSGILGVAISPTSLSPGQVLEYNGANWVPTAATSVGTNYWTLSGNNLYPNAIASVVGIGNASPGSNLLNVSTVQATSGAGFGINLAAQQGAASNVGGAVSITGGAAGSGSTPGAVGINTSGASPTNIGTGSSTGNVSIGNAGNSIFFPALSIAGGVYYTTNTGAAGITANGTVHTVLHGGAGSTPTFSAVGIADIGATGTPGVTNFLNGGGTWSTAVTSVGLSLPAIFTVSGSPVTTSGTLTGTLASETANTIFAAPNGSAGTPTFRALATADLPLLGQSSTTTFGTAATTLSAASWAALSNMSQTFTVPANSTVYISTFGGIGTTSGSITGESDIEIGVWIDGVTLLAEEGLFVANSPSWTGLWQEYSIQASTTLSAGSHNVTIYGYKLGGSNATVGGSSATQLMSGLTVTILKN